MERFERTSVERPAARAEARQVVVRRRGRGIAWVAAAALLCAGAAQAQEATPGARRQDDSRFSVRGSIGFTADPDTFLMTLEVPWKANDLVSVGPLFQLGFSDDDVLVAPTLEVYLTPQLADDLRDLHPYAHLGMGFMYLEKDHRRPGRDEEDADFLLTTGFGAEYAVQENLFVGTGFLFDIVPGGVAGERFVFGWQMLTLRAAF